MLISETIILQSLLQRDQSLRELRKTTGLEMEILFPLLQHLLVMNKVKYKDRLYSAVKNPSIISQNNAQNIEVEEKFSFYDLDIQDPELKRLFLDYINAAVKISSKKVSLVA